MLLSRCQVTAIVVGCRVVCFSNGSMATMTLLWAYEEGNPLCSVRLPLSFLHNLLLQAGKYPALVGDGREEKEDR